METIELLKEFKDLLLREHAQNSKIISKQRASELLAKVEEVLHKQLPLVLYKQLAHVQIIERDNWLYSELDNLTSDDMDSLECDLINAGYHLGYNSVEDVYVIY